MAQSSAKSRRAEPDGFLVALGERIRTLRAMRGMSRKSLAKDAAISERFLADLETGSGNASILLLKQLAGALALPLTELVAQDAPANGERALTLQLLSKLTETELSEAKTMLKNRFAPDDDGSRRLGRIALVGLRGAGKSTLAMKLAKALECPYVELNREIERATGMSSEQVHVMLGQAAYRRYERRALEAVIAAHSRVVIATPGSLVSEAPTYSYLLSHCFTVWLKANPEEHMARVVEQGDLRPMAGNKEAMNDLRRILAGRTPLYAKADLTIDTSGKTVASSLDETLRALLQHGVDIPGKRPRRKAA